MRRRAGREVRARRRACAALTSIAVGVGAVGALAPDALAVGAVFVVDSVLDTRDADPGDGECETAAPRVCTLRAAIEEANASPGHDRIEFDIPGAPNQVHTIAPNSALPVIRDGAGVTIDGYTQPGAAPNTLAAGSNAQIRIELEGTGSGGIDGLYFQSSDNVVRGLALYDFRIAVRFWAGSPSVHADRNLIAGNFIGTDASGTFRAGGRTSSGDGVHLQQGARYNRIGGPADADRNVISGSSGRGVGTFNPDTDHNIIENNIIGLNPAGTVALGNWAHGVDVNYGSSHNIVRDNVISGNALSGVEISHDALGAQFGHGGVGDTGFNVVEGNLIGTDPSGASAASRYGNGEYGIGLEGRGSCAFSCPPDSNDNEIVDNVIVGSDVNVKIWRGSHRNVVRGNSIGVLADGVTGSSVSTTWGVLVEVGSIDNLIEGNHIAEVGTGIAVRPISENPGDGVFAVYGNTFRGNRIEHVSPGLGVDLAPEGTPTASPDPQLVQHGVSFGEITGATTDGATVEACPGCAVELFETEPTTSAYGQGRRSLGTAIATGGTATFVFRDDVSDPYVVSEGDAVSALVTESHGSTSEFSRRVTVGAGSIGTGTTTTTATATTTTTTTTTTVPSTTTTAVPPTTSSVPPTTTTSVPSSSTSTVAPSSSSTVPPSTVVSSTTTSTTTPPVPPTTAPPGPPTTVPGAVQPGGEGRAERVAVRCAASVVC